MSRFVFGIFKIDGLCPRPMHQDEDIFGQFFFLFTGYNIYLGLEIEHIRLNYADP